MSKLLDRIKAMSDDCQRQLDEIYEKRIDGPRTAFDRIAYDRLELVLVENGSDDPIPDQDEVKVALADFLRTSTIVKILRVGLAALDAAADPQSE
jgi:hypothetical protein